MTSSRARSSGQGTVEYLILISLAVGVIMGVIYPIISRQITSVQDAVASRATSVLAQREMGIPICWFYCDSANPVNLGANAQGGALGNPSGAGRNSKDSSDASGDGAGATGAGAGGAAGDTTSNLGGSGPRTGNRGAGGGDGSGGDDEESKSRTVESRTGGSGGGSGLNNSGSVEGDESKAKQDDDLSEDEKAAEDPADSGDGTVKGRRALTRDVEGRAGGCRDMNLFTLLKLAALIAVIVIVIAVALSSRGRKKNG